MAEQVLAAIHVLYTSHDTREKDGADKWLEQWQQCPEAWSTSDGILHTPGVAGDAAYFCAQTLKTKVQRDYNELPAEAVAALRDSLFALLLRYAKDSPAVRTQLCLALAALAAHAPAALWGEQGVLGWLMNAFSSQPREVALSCMLELMTVLPQEVDSRRIACRPERRADFTRELQAAAPAAMDLLSSCLSVEGERLRRQVLEAWGCWLRLTPVGGGISAAGPALASHPLVAAALEGLSREATFDAAVDAVCELLAVVVDPTSGCPAPAHAVLAQNILSRVMSFQQRFTTIVHREVAEAEGREVPDDDINDNFDDDPEAVKGMARLFVEVAEAFLGTVLGASPDVALLLQVLLEVTRHPDADIHSLTFPFWQRLAGELMDRQHSASGGGVSSPRAGDAAGGSSAAAIDPAEQQRRHQFFIPTFEALTRTLLRQMRLPDQVDFDSSSARREWKLGRSAAGEVLVSSAGVLGPDAALLLLVGPLEPALAAGDWRTAEVALHGMRCVRRLPWRTPHPQLEALLNGLPSLTPGRGPPQLQYSAALLLSAYTPWLADHLAAAGQAGSGTALLNRLIAWLYQCMSVPQAVPAVAVAMRHLCEDCGPHMAACLPGLIDLYKQALTGGAASSRQPGNSSGSSSTPGLHPAQAAGGTPPAAGLELEEEDVQMVIEGVVTVVRRCLGPAELTPALLSLLQPVLGSLATAATSFAPRLTGGPAGSFREQVYLVDRLAMLLRNVNAPPAAAELLKQSWPALDAAMSRSTDSTSALEHCCRALRYGLKASGRSCSPLLPLLLETLPARFQQTRHPAFMYVVSELVKIFADEPAADTVLGPILQQLLTTACAGLNTIQALEDAPDLVDDIFLLASRACSYCPRMLVTPQLLPPLLDTAMYGVLVQHREACCSTLTFLCRLLDMDPSKALNNASGAVLEEEVGRVGPMLTRLLMAGVVGLLVSGRVPDVGAVICAALKSRGAVALQWLVTAVAAIPDVALQDTDKQVLTNKASMLAGKATMGFDDGDLIDELEHVADICRLTKRVRVAAQQALLPPELHGLVH